MARPKPYPESTDRVKVAVFCMRTGEIKRLVTTTLTDEHRQHDVSDDYHYIDVTGKEVDLHEHVVDLRTMKLKPRTKPSLLHLVSKEHELREQARLAVPEIDLMTVMLRASAGDEDAKTTAREHAAAREAAGKKLAALVEQAQAAKTRKDLEKIKW